MSDSDLSQDIVIPPDESGNFKYLAEIYANDATGARLRDVRKGDVVRIDSISGWCSFSTGSPMRTLKKIASIAVPLVGGQLSGVAKTALDTVKKHGNFSEDEPTKGKVRNGYGKVRGKDKFAAKEGGIIVCMPAAGEPIQADGGSHLDDDAEKNGRLPQYVKPRLRNRCFFPCREDGGIAEMEASKGGTAWILVFDSKHQDNDGVYEVEFTVIRN